MSILTDMSFRYLSSEDQTVLRKIGSKLDALGYFPTSAFRVIAENRHFQMFVPDGRGGLGMDLVTAAEVIEEYSFIEGNLGWIVQIGAGGGLFSAYLSPETGRDFFSQPDQVVAGSDFVGGTAHSEKGGYRISGLWKYASGSMHASAFTGSVRIKDGPHAGEIRAFIVSSHQVDIHLTWKAMGMRATDSHEFVLEDVFVPEDHMFSLNRESLQILPTPIFQIPFLVFARAVFVPVLSGLALQYLELYQGMLRRKKFELDSDAYRVGKMMEQELSEVRRKFFETIRSIWRYAESGMVPEEISTDFSEFCVEMTSVCLRLTENCHRYTGMEGIRLDAPINITYRNIVTAAAHYLLSGDSL